MHHRQKLNPHGVIGVLFVILVFVIAFYLKWNIIWWYFVLSVVLYSGAVIFLTITEEEAITKIKTSPSPSNTVDLLMINRFLLGCHLALLFLAIGLLIHFSTFSLHSFIGQIYDIDLFRILFFFASILGGLAIPFMILKILQGKNSINPNGVLGIILIILMFGIAFYYRWNISWLYFVGAVALYSGATIYLNLVVDFSQESSPPQIFKLRLSTHLVFMFWMLGLGLHFQEDGINLGFFIASIASGLALPYLLFRST